MMMMMMIMMIMMIKGIPVWDETEATPMRGSWDDSNVIELG